MTEKVLIVDDSGANRLLLGSILKKSGYDITEAVDGQQALERAFDAPPDLILLDIMMPNMDGFQFLPALRRESQVPVIIITARDEETDAVLGLELGADDYVIKPFRLRELIARVRSQLRRQGTPVEPGEFLRIGDLVLDRASHLVKVADKEVDLTPIEFDLLSVLMRSPGRVYTRSDLVNELTESGFAGLESTLNVHMRNLRLKIEPDPSRPIYLETVFGVGYRMNKQGAT